MSDDKMIKIKSGDVLKIPNKSKQRFKNIAYYISDYGYGHASRSIAIIRYLLRSNLNINIFICSSYAIEFLMNSLKNEFLDRIHFRNLINDFGYKLLENSIEVDFSQMNIAYSKYKMNSKAYLKDEVQFLRQAQINLVISDISPLPFKAAYQANIVSVGISNFTWYTAYQNILEQDRLIWIYQTYKYMDYFIPLAGSCEPEWGKKVGNEMQLFSRDIKQEKIRSIQKMLNPGKKHYLVYFGLGMKIDMDDLSELEIWNSENCIFIVSENTPIMGANIYKIPRDETETQNFIAASNLVISKPGWATVSEAFQSRIPMIILDRMNMREDQNMIHYLKSKNYGFYLSWDEFQHFRINNEFKEQSLKSVEQIQRVDNELVLESLKIQIDSILYNS